MDRVCDISGISIPDPIRQNDLLIRILFLLILEQILLLSGRKKNLNPLGGKKIQGMIEFPVGHVQIIQRIRYFLKAQLAMLLFGFPDKRIDSFSQFFFPICQFHGGSVFCIHTHLF